MINKPKDPNEVAVAKEPAPASATSTPDPAESPKTGMEILSLKTSQYSLLVSAISLAVALAAFLYTAVPWNSFSYNVPELKETLLISPGKPSRAIIDLLLTFYNNGNRPVLLENVQLFILTSMPSEQQYFFNRDCAEIEHSGGDTQLSLFEGDSASDSKNIAGDDSKGTFGGRQIAPVSIASGTVVSFTSRYSPFFQLNDDVKSVGGILCLKVGVRSIAGKPVVDYRLLDRFNWHRDKMPAFLPDGLTTDYMEMHHLL